MDNKDINIESYDGNDAYYSGTDEEYEEFLKNADIKIDAENVEAVENTQKINLNDTINLQSVLNKFRKTADGLENGARKFKESVVNRMDKLKSKKEEDEQNIIEEAMDDIQEKVKNTVKNSVQKIDDIKEDVESFSNMPDKLENLEGRFENLQNTVLSLSEKLDSVLEKLGMIDAQDRDYMKDHERNYSDIRRSFEDVTSGIADLKQTVNSFSKLNDSLFDMKNTQLNTKNAVADLETGFKRLKKKCVLGVTVLSVLSAITIVLEIVLMLS